LLFSGDWTVFAEISGFVECKKAQKNRFMEYGSAINAALRAVLTVRNASIKGKNLQNYKKDTDITRELSVS
jgi:hypothetical protein